MQQVAQVATGENIQQYLIMSLHVKSTKSNVCESCSTYLGKSELSSTIKIISRFRLPWFRASGSSERWKVTEKSNNLWAKRKTRGRPQTTWIDCIRNGYKKKLFYRSMQNISIPFHLSVKEHLNMVGCDQKLRAWYKPTFIVFK